jgi:hypothetical protein
MELRQLTSTKLAATSIHGHTIGVAQARIAEHGNDVGHEE